jgi:ankyrin repeat protein
LETRVARFRASTTGSPRLASLGRPHGPLPAQRAVDAFVGAAHDQPRLAALQLTQNTELAGSTASWGETALQAASHLGHRKLVSTLLEYGVSLDVFAAAALGEVVGVASFVATPGQLGICGIHGLPLMHFAVMSRDVRTLESLIAWGVPPDPPGSSLSALHSAVSIGSRSMVRILVSAGANVMFRDAFGATPLDWANDLHIGDAMTVELLSGLQVNGAGANARAARPAAWPDSA